MYFTRRILFGLSVIFPLTTTTINRATIACNFFIFFPTLLFAHHVSIFIELWIAAYLRYIGGKMNGSESLVK